MLDSAPALLPMVLSENKIDLSVGLVWFVALVVSYGNPFARRRQTKHTNAMQTLTADDPDVGE